MKKNPVPLLIIACILLVSLFSGCTTTENNDSNKQNQNFSEKIIIPGQLKVIGDFKKINVSKISVRTGVKQYIDENNPDAGFEFSFVDGMQHDVENDAGIFFYIRGNIENIAEENLEYVTITANFTDENQTNLNIIRNDTIRRLVPNYTGLFEIGLQEDVKHFEKVEYVTLTITYE